MLPFIDEHRQHVTAAPDAIWAAVAKTMRGLSGGTFARVLGCDPATGSPGFTARLGESVPGFRVAAADAQHLELRGRHRFSRYALTFTLAGDELRAESRAEFPGVLGKLYRGAVIGTGIHRLVTRKLLRDIARRATPRS
jgi:hypothetical protein